MLNKLVELIFGLNEYEKTKIEDRFFIVKDIILKLEIRKVEDFEILEDIIYKIKEELRIKSSNLNKTISNRKRNLSKKDVENVLVSLNKIKYDFLNKAFNTIVDFSKNELKEDNIDEIISNNLKVLTNENFEIKLENGKIPFIIINFFKEVNFIIINKISNIFFHIILAHGTNVIIENNKVLIVPRFNDDYLFNLPRIQVDIENIFNIFLKNNKIIEEENNNFIEIDNLKNKKVKQSLKSKEDSLDSLLDEIESKKPNFNSHPNPNDDKSKSEFLKDDSIEFEMKEKEIKNDGIEIVREKFDINEVEKNKLEIVNEKEEKINEKEILFDTKKFEIYKDEKILVYLNENSSVLGEIFIESIEGENINNFDDSKLAYISIFSKVFSSILFEIISASGTNLIWNFNSNKIKIIPRFENDNLKNLKWDTKSNTNEFLEQVKNKLISKMSEELKVEEVKNIEPSNNLVKEIKEEKIETDNDLEEKAKFILDSLRKIP